jgi:D-lactate dehydrogenase
LLEVSDVISLHTQLSAATYHLLNSETLSHCRKGVLIINTSRGRLIDTTALLEALDSGQVGGAGLDVLEDERMIRQPASKIITQQIVENLKADVEPEKVQHRVRMRNLHKLVKTDTLLSRKNVVFTPHIAVRSVESGKRLNAATVETIRAFAKGRPIRIVKP